MNQQRTAFQKGKSIRNMSLATKYLSSTLSKGGGGNITLKSFIEEVKKDFPDFD